MKLVIDYGNTLIKTALFRDESMIDLRLCNNLSSEQLNMLIDEFEYKNSEYKPIEYAIFSSVVNYADDIKTILSNRFNFIELNFKTPLPVTIKYKTPETLGNDRIAAVVAASGLFPSTDLLVIDAGTCITYDFINSKSEYIGGGITPGIDMRFKALNNFTGKLPLVSKTDNAALTGNTTQRSIQSGVLNGIVAEINGIIDRYKHEFPSIKIIFTGGDVNYFDRKLKNDIFAVSNLVLKGLNIILDYNVEK
ncbi:MAG: type III pantothenate kinase [Bacteroidetes bacterium]|nr:type III pantothenate kinase [Bacteroidota bacterium]MBL7105496.1 type III pantothenate kinase [Bacteroidales bacterium]